LERLQEGSVRASWLYLFNKMSDDSLTFPLAGNLGFSLPLPPNDLIHPIHILSYLLYCQTFTLSTVSPIFSPPSLAVLSPFDQILGFPVLFSAESWWQGLKM